jgi:hypothetical protein
MSFSPNLFLSNIKGKDGLARPARYEVILPIPEYIGNAINNSIIEKILNLPNSAFSEISEAIGNALGQKNDAQKSANPGLTRYLALQCETAELPGKTIQTEDVKIYGPTFKVPYQTQYAETSLTFLCTNEFYERKLFDRWMEAIMPTDTNNLRYPKGRNSRYLTQITITQFDDLIKQIYAVNLIDAFPIGVAAQPLSWSEEGFHRVTVQFAYQKYRPIYDGTYNLAAAATALFGSGLSRILPLGRAL